MHPVDIVIVIFISPHLLGIFLAYITALLSGVCRPTKGICVMHRLGPPVATSLIYVSLAVKTIRLYRIYRASVRSVERPQFISPDFQVSVTLVISALPVSQIGAYSQKRNNFSPGINLSLTQTYSFFFCFAR